MDDNFFKLKRNESDKIKFKKIHEMDKIGFKRNQVNFSIEKRK